MIHDVGNKGKKKKCIRERGLYTRVRLMGLRERKRGTEADVSFQVVQARLYMYMYIVFYSSREHVYMHIATG